MRAVLFLSLVLVMVLGTGGVLFSQEEEEEAAMETTTTTVTADTATQTVVASSPTVMDIQRLNTKEELYSIELRNVDLGDLFRLIAHDYQLNILVDKNVSGTVTASLTNISLEEALESIAEMQGLLLEKKKNVIVVKRNLITKVFLLNHLEARSLLEEATSSSTSGTETTETSTEGESTSSSTTSSSSTSSTAARLYDLLSDQGKVLLGRQPNSLMVIDYPENVAKVEEYINMVDKGMTSRVFKLKYISARTLVGEGTVSSDSGEESTDQAEDTGEEG